MDSTDNRLDKYRFLFNSIPILFNIFETNKKQTMKRIFLLLFLLSAFLNYGQDSIITYRVKKINAQIVEITKDSIKYKMEQKQSVYSINKKEVFEIKYQSGERKDFFSDTEKSQPIEELKKHIVGLINEYGFDEDSDKKRYFASFEGDHLRLKIKNASGTKMNNGFLFEFYNVIAFHEVAKRSEKISFVNIWLHFLDAPENKNKWAKQKLIMKVKGNTEAEDILHSLKLYNRMLIDKKKSL
jgi:hypothetical protein